MKRSSRLLHAPSARGTCSRCYWTQTSVDGGSGREEQEPEKRTSCTPLYGSSEMPRQCQQWSNECLHATRATLATRKFDGDENVKSMAGNELNRPTYVILTWNLFLRGLYEGCNTKASLFTAAHTQNIRVAYEAGSKTSDLFNSIRYVS